MHKPLRVLVILGSAGAACSLTVLGVVTTVSSSALRGGNMLVSGQDSVAVDSITELGNLGSISAGRGRSFYLLQIRVENSSGTSSFDFDPHMILVRSLSGDKAVRSSRGQAQEGPQQMTIPPSTVRERVIVFEGVRGMKRMSVRFNTLGGPGVLVSSLFGTPAQVILEVK